MIKSFSCTINSFIKAPDFFLQIYFIILNHNRPNRISSSLKQIAEIQFCSLFDPNKHSLSATSRPFRLITKISVPIPATGCVISVETVLAPNRNQRGNIGCYFFCHWHVVTCEISGQKAFHRRFCTTQLSLQK